MYYQIWNIFYKYLKKIFNNYWCTSVVGGKMEVWIITKLTAVGMLNEWFNVYGIR